jgi:hypothetical protein
VVNKNLGEGAFVLFFRNLADNDQITGNFLAILLYSTICYSLELLLFLCRLLDDTIWRE